MNWRDLAKYFVHGVAFSLLFTVLALAWVAVMVVLVMFGLFLGLIIGLGLLILIVGAVNSVITALLWFPVRHEFWDVFLHGLALLVILAIVNAVTVLLPLYLFSGIATTIILFITGSFIDGFVSKKVAAWWIDQPSEGVSPIVEAEWRDKNL